MRVTTTEGKYLGDFVRFLRGGEEVMVRSPLDDSGAEVRTIQMDRLGSDRDLLRSPTKPLRTRRLGFARWLIWNTPGISDEIATYHEVDLTGVVDIESDFETLLVQPTHPNYRNYPLAETVRPAEGVDQEPRASGRAARLAHMLRTPPDEWF